MAGYVLQQGADECMDSQRGIIPGMLNRRSPVGGRLDGAVDDCAVVPFAFGVLPAAGMVSKLHVVLCHHNEAAGMPQRADRSGY